MIDAHCHVDLYPNPLEIIKECEQHNILTLGMTNLPSHFELGFNHVVSCKNVRLALGMHPLFAKQHFKELPIFIKNLHKTSYIGEIGLDFSKEGIKSKSIQLDSFNKILNSLKGKNKILSLHSRNAESEVLDNLKKYEIQTAIFHWYTGHKTLIPDIINSGYYFSINPAMIKSKSGQEIISIIPADRVLTESDGPFIEINGKSIKPSDVANVEKYLAKQWQTTHANARQIIHNNFKSLLNFIR